MAISLSDIEFFLSGGPTNSNPNNSLGGQPSSFLVLGSMNNLFSDISTEEADSGKTDYRCVYVFNESETDSLYETKVYFGEEGSGGSSVMLGTYTATEIQKVGIIGPVSSGSVEFRYDSTNFTVNWGASAGQFETNLQAALNGVAPGTSVSTSVQGNSYYFTVSFLGESDNRSHPLLVMVNNGLLAPDTPIVSISRVAEGSPINSVAPLISVETVPPTKVVFQNADESSKLIVGTLGPGDGVPIWIKRITPAGTDYMEKDYFKFKITGRPF